MAGDTEWLRKRCEERGIHVMPSPFAPARWTYLGAFPPARTWITEREALEAALVHYRALYPDEAYP